jgi:hypothetical protein
MSDRTRLSRRGFLRAGTVAGMGILGGSFLNFGQLARAQATPDHFFLFIELKGGVCWPYATDARDLAELPMTDAKVVRSVALAADGTTPALPADQREAIIGGLGANTTQGNVIILPYVDSLEATYKKGTTNTGAKWTLGISAGPLAPYVNDIAVVRGVRSIHNFHGGANDEAFCGIFSDHQDQQRKHIAGTVAAALAAERGAMLLDNVVFEGASFAGKTAADFAAPMRIDVRSLGNLANGQSPEQSATTAEQRFARARRLAEAVGNAQAIGPQHKEVFAAYLSALEKTPAVQKRLAEIASRLQSTDASLDLDMQVDTALTLFESGLTRVATLCLGASNGMNNVDGFGLFDAHYGLLHKSETASARRTYGHWLNVQQAMQSIARLIELLKTKQRNGKSLFEQTTVVITSEFSRPSNASGNEDNSGAFGAGHYNYNNNVIMFGKGVRGGGWIGQNDPVTQYSHLVETATLEQPDPNGIRYSVPDFFTLDEASNTKKVTLDGRIEGLSAEAAIDFLGGEKRPIMTKDVLRTVFKIAGADSKFRSVYSGRWFADAKTLGPTIG